MFSEERQQAILEMLKRNGRVEVPLLRDLLQVSEDTVRRDLKAMEEEGLLKRTHGGAIPRWRTGEVVQYGERLEMQQSDKEAIARTAVNYVKDGDTVFLEGSSTVVRMVPHLAKFNGLTILTHSVAMAHQVMINLKTARLFMIGGTVDAKRANTYGAETIDALRKIHVDKVFTGACAISLQGDLYSTDMEEASVKRAMMNAGREIFVLADSSKFGQKALAFVSPILPSYTLITDDGYRQITGLELDDTVAKRVVVALAEN